MTTNPTDTLELLPCPWCKGEACIATSDNRYEHWVECLECKARGSEWDFDANEPDFALIAKDWNTRAANQLAAELAIYKGREEAKQLVINQLEADNARLREEVGRLDTSETKLIGERDAAEECAGEMYESVVGAWPEWSNAFGYDDAVNEVHEKFTTTQKQLVTEKEQREKLEKDAAAFREGVQKLLTAYDDYNTGKPVTAGIYGIRPLLEELRTLWIQDILKAASRATAEERKKMLENARIPQGLMEFHCGKQALGSGEEGR